MEQETLGIMRMLEVHSLHISYLASKEYRVLGPKLNYSLREGREHCIFQ